MNNIFTPLAVTIIPVGPDGESPPRVSYGTVTFDKILSFCVGKIAVKSSL